MQNLEVKGQLAQQIEWKHDMTDMTYQITLLAISVGKYLPHSIPWIFAGKETIQTFACSCLQVSVVDQLVQLPTVNKTVTCFKVRPRLIY